MSEAILSRLDSIEQLFKQGDRPLSFKEGAAYLGCSISYLYKLTHRRLIPFYKPLGKKIYFRRQELESFLCHKPVLTKDQIEQKAIDHVVCSKGGRS